MKTNCKNCSARPRPAPAATPSAPAGFAKTKAYAVACFVFAFFLHLVPPAQAQQVLLQAAVADDTVAQVTGPNRRYFGHLYAGYALAAGPSAAPTLAVRYGPGSAETQLGGRLKRRVSQVLALNADVRYAYLRYALAQTDRKTVPTAARHESESLSWHQVQGELSLRLNPGRRRGNVVGHYLDLLGYGGYGLATAHTTQDDDPAGGSRLETVAHGPVFLRRWLGGAGVRLGSGRYALVGRYRFAAAFAEATSFSEPPRWALGLEVGWF